MRARGFRPELIEMVLAVIAVGLLLAIIPVSAQAASAGDLCLYGSDGGENTGDAMMPGTSPSITALAGGGAEVAFQTASGNLATYDDVDHATNDTAYTLDPTTNPSISANGSNIVIAFAAQNTDELYSGNGINESSVGVVVKPGSSPAVAAMSSGAEYAYVSQNDYFSVGDGNNWSSSGYGGAPNTSPAITALTGGGWEATFQGGDNYLYSYSSGGYTADPEDPGTSPAITATPTSGDYEIAYTRGSTLWLNGSIVTANAGEGMMAGTSPAITAVDGTYEVAFQANTGDLYLNGGDPNYLGTDDAMAPGTSPAITTTTTGYEIAFQCAATNSTTSTAGTTTTATTPPPTTTTPVTVTTPAPTITTPTPSRKPRIREQLAFDMTWTGTSSHIIRVTSARRLPKTTVITVSCLRTRTARCPRLGKAPTKAKRTVAKELAVLNGRTFPHNIVLRFTVSAPGYLTEIISARLPGDGPPRSTNRWK